ncbi:hypothetical protein VPNG_06279 [Cytospora leucostoma]|uniref:RRM domain-containing protein n=1 Tax=Cytospora leucostoma TaxID=1230097 RepID=A0A423X270_9PEZI|nr:hypothetical protein VPNG_06279 [Cytospora leucostoma]
MASEHTFEPFSFEGQQDVQKFAPLPSAEFPLALRPAGDWKPSLQESVDAIRHLANSGELKRLINKHGGALIIRGLPIKTAEDYSEVAHAFGFVAHEEVGRPPVRTVLAKNVKTANEGPAELPIWPHSEYGWSTIHPAWVSFTALAVPESGGETPITSGLGLAKALREQAPRFVENLRKRGVKYVYRYGVAKVVSSTGASIFDAYGQHVKPEDDEITVRKKVEQEVRRHSDNFEWHEDGSLSVTHVVPIIRKNEDYGLTTWFGNLTSAWGRSKHHGATEPPYRGDDGSYHPPPLYGDGTVIESDYLDLALAIAESSQVLIKWEQGDVVLLDMPIQHRLARKPEKTEAARRRRVFIANLPTTRTRAEVGEFIEQQGFEGPLVFYWKTLEKSGPHNGICWVSFDDEATAQRAINTINNKVYDGKRLRVEAPIDPKTKDSQQGTAATLSPPAPHAGPAQVTQGMGNLTLAEQRANMARYIQGVNSLDQAVDGERRAMPEATHEPRVTESHIDTASVIAAHAILDPIHAQGWPDEYFVNNDQPAGEALGALIERCKELDSAYMRAGVQEGLPVLKMETTKEVVIGTETLVARSYPSLISENDGAAATLPVVLVKKVSEIDKSWQHLVVKDAVPGSQQAETQAKFPFAKKIVDVKTVPMRDVTSHIAEGWGPWHQVITPASEDVMAVAPLVDVWDQDKPWNDTMRRFDGKSKHWA